MYGGAIALIVKTAPANRSGTPVMELQFGCHTASRPGAFSLKFTG
jgi:hypothetical protein